VLPVTALNGSPIGIGEAGDGFNRLVNQWRLNTGVDIIRQIKKSDAERTGSATNSAPTPYWFKSK